MARSSTTVSRPRSAARPSPASGAARESTSRRPSNVHRPDFIAIGLGLAGVLLALALLRPGSSGTVGLFMLRFTRFWVGHAVLVVPILLLGSGIALALDHRRATNPQMLWGVTGLLALLFGWIHLLITPQGQVFDTTGARLAELVGRPHEPELILRADGGFLGAAIMSLLHPLGRMGSFVTLGAVGLASVLLITELTLRAIVERLHERSRIAAEATRRTARVVGERTREVKERLPRPRRQSLFLELEEEEEEQTAAISKRTRRERALPVPDAEDEAAAPTGLQTTLDEIEPAPRERAIVPVEAFEERHREPTPSAGKNAVAEKASAGKARMRSPRQAAGGTGVASSDDYVFPSLDLLDPPQARPKKGADETQANIAILENTLAQFRIQAQVVEIADGPTVTRYEIRLGEGIRVKKILDLADNIAMSLSAMSVRVEAPIPGKAAIGIEVPKKHSSVVTLRESLESEEARDLKSKVGFVLGKDVAGQVRCADLAKMPHLLVAGATNSGKSVCLNVLIASMLYRARPDELKMIMIDPKRVELTLFDGIPHLIHPVVKDVKQAAGILRWVLKEMDRRYDLFAQVMTRNIEGYNEKASRQTGPLAPAKLPYLVVVIDELADLMMQQGPEVEQAICRLAQLARATGIHLVIATQRPSVDVITGLIKANVPSRIAFSVSSQIDSRTILDCKGAENLIGRGDMLFKPVDASKPVRIQGAFLREEEVEAMVKHLKTQGRPEYLAEPLTVDHGAYGHESPEETEDEMFEPAARFVVTTGHASTSMIQRKFKIGYTRAARLVDMMEARGIVGALDGAKPREILMSRDQLDDMFLQVRNSVFGGGSYEEAEEDEEGEDEAPVEEQGPAVRTFDPFVDE